MLAINVRELNFGFGEETLLEKVSFHIKDKERVGLIGANGTGKSSLLRIISGELKVLSGSVFIGPNMKIGILRQQPALLPGRTVLEEAIEPFKGILALEKEIEELADRMGREKKNPQEAMKDAQILHQLNESYIKDGGLTYMGRVKSILSNMAFPQEMYDKKIADLSGGEQSRLGLAVLLLSEPDILLLDEPTNHLDLSMIKWLEEYLASYKGSLICVSHDRYFIDMVTDRILEIDNKKVLSFTGGYEYYAKAKKQIREEELKKALQNEKEYKRQERMIRSLKERGTEKLAKRAASREKQLGKMEVVERPKSHIKKINLLFKEEFPSGKDVIHCENLSKAFPDQGEEKGGGEGKKLFANINLDIKRGEKVCFVGPNGVGKTTLLKIIMGQISQTDGYLKIGHNVSFSYYDQGQIKLNQDNSLLEELKEAYRLYTDTEMRTILGSFLFYGDKVFNKISCLSGGEKSRLSLLKMMLKGANTLVFDEPTNHLDIESKEAFEDAIINFPGTVIFVSHDRYFLNKVPDRILELRKDGIYESKEYLITDTSFKAKEKPGLEKQGLSNSAQMRAKQKEREAEIRKLERLIIGQEELVKDLEEEKLDLSRLVNKKEVAEDPTKLGEIAKRMKQIDEKLEKEYDNWHLYHEKLEKTIALDK